MEKEQQYDPHKYWQERGKNYSANNPTWDMESAMLLEQVRILTYLKGRAPRVLEVGPAYGRVYKYLKKHGHVIDMVDIVDSMIDQCEVETGVRPDKWDGVELPYDDTSYDLIISYSVMLHVRPENIRRHVQEMLRVAEEVYIATYLGTESSYHCFAHDYDSLFEELDVFVQHKWRFGPTRVNYVIRRKKK